jgi:hypothetical protein
MASNCKGLASWWRVWCLGSGRSARRDQVAALEAGTAGLAGSAGGRGRGGSRPAAGPGSMMGWGSKTFRGKGGRSNG